MMGGRATVRIGTSGWSYPHWRGNYYPDDLSQEQWLARYAEDFNTVEINNTFYQLPEAATLKQWRAEVGSGFVFTVKASRYITHMKKLKDPRQSLKKFLARIRILGETLGPVLFQLPPNWKCNTERLSEFLDALPDWLRAVFEFRDESWFDSDIFTLLKNANAAFCIYELAGRKAPIMLTADFAYVRLHGPHAAYSGAYSRNALMQWAARFREWTAQGREVFCYFDNDEAAYAVHNALALRKLMGQK